MTRRVRLPALIASAAVVCALAGGLAPSIGQAAPTPPPKSSTPSRMPFLLPPAVNSEASLQPNTLHLLRLLEHLFPYYKNGGAIYGYRQDPIADHPSGQALDIMMNNGGRDPKSVAEGNLIAAFLMANANQLGIDYMVWRQNIWYPGRAWRQMDDRANWTDNHMDHIHVKVFGSHQPSDDLLLPADINLADGQLPDGEALRVIHEQRVALQGAVDGAKTRVAAALVEYKEHRNRNSRQTATLNKAQRKVNTAVRDSYILGMDAELLARSTILMNAQGLDPATVIAAERVLRTEHNQVESSLNALTLAQRELHASQTELTSARQALKDAQTALTDFNAQKQARSASP